ncbi:START domain-containing protein [Halopseudomonas laoshanensis]|uniref:START domain-containing protein n=1 Tax=Halopseudomonas laoshanensis TaxID=2268758 RepID=UPI0015B474AB|nr:START domain-containing protein [Halopseudomonas laoshanensis]
MGLLLLTTLALSLSGRVLAVEVERVSRDGPDEIRATVSVAAPVTRVLTLLEQPCHLLQWVPKVRSLTVLARPGENLTLVYMATDLGWPMQLRDSVTLFTRSEGPPVTLTMQSRPDSVPAVDGYQRIPFSEGSWTLYAEQADTTRVEYVQRVEPGGQVSQWLSDRVGVTEVAELLQALRDYAAGSRSITCGDDTSDPGLP